MPRQYPHKTGSTLGVGATRATARGYLRGMRDEAIWVLRATAGQHMRVEIRSPGATRGVVLFPSGQQDGGPGGVVFDGKLPETGDVAYDKLDVAIKSNDFLGKYKTWSEGGSLPAALRRAMQ